MFALQKLLAVLDVLLHSLPCVCLCSQWKFSACGTQVPHIFCLSKAVVASTRWTPMGYPEHILSFWVSKYSCRSPASTTPSSARDRGRLDMIKGVYASAGSPALPCPSRQKPQTAAAQGAVLGQTSLT